MNSMFSSVMLESASVVATRENNSAWRRVLKKKEKEKNRKEVDDFQRLYRLIRSL